MSGVSVDLHIEDMSAAGKGMVWSFNLRLVLRCTFIIYRHMVGVGVVVLVRNARDYAEFLLVASCETACKALRRSCKNAVVVFVCLAELVDLASHECHNAESEFL